MGKGRKYEGGHWKSGIGKPVKDERIPMKFRRFTKPQFLKEIGRELLVKFFGRFTAELAEKKIVLPAENLKDDEYFQLMSRVAMAPDGLPDGLYEAIYAIDEMATEEGQERLEQAMAQGLLVLKVDEKSSRGDIAMQAYLTAPEVLAQKNNELRLARLSSFEYFGTKKNSTPHPTHSPIEVERANAGISFAAPSKETLDLLTKDLDEWFKENNRGDHTANIELYALDGEFWFLVRHGDTFARMAKLEMGKLRMLHFRPAKDDVAVYSPSWDEIRIHAGSKRERELYQRTFGIRLFGDDRHFSEKKAFTLEPLRVDGAGALEWDGGGDVERIVLREIETAWGGAYHAVTIRKSDDIFLDAEGKPNGGKAIPDAGRLVRAAFDFYFEGVTKPRKVHIRPPNVLKLGRYCDASVVQRWLSEKGFRETAKKITTPGEIGLSPQPSPGLQRCPHPAGDQPLHSQDAPHPACGHLLPIKCGEGKSDGRGTTPALASEGKRGEGANANVETVAVS
jgi:hypothetical protein